MPIFAPTSPPPPPTSSVPLENGLYLDGAAVLDKVVEVPPPKVLELPQSESGKFPVVKLDTEYITDTLAARLAISLLGHVLYLKNQVPFPVVQLSRIPGGKSNARATKLRSELLESFDTLTSHLNTTFTSLSTALAHSSFKKNNLAVENPSSLPGDAQLARAYIAIIVGPSIGSAKARILYAVDGLQVKAWGERDDILEDKDHNDDDGTDNEDDVDDDSSETTSVSNDIPGSETNSSSDTSNSRSPSPSDVVSPPPYSYADEQSALNAADRLLSRTLALADGDGRGMAHEMPPTQTHILLRAPRRFSHPAWIPRQNLSSSLEATLNEFLAESTTTSVSESEVNIRKSRKGSKTEGVWVTCRGGNMISNLVPAMHISGDERDEMIWWSWDGKIAGFSDW